MAEGGDGDEETSSPPPKTPRYHTFIMRVWPWARTLVQAASIAVRYRGMDVSGVVLEGLVIAGDGVVKWLEARRQSSHR